MGDDKFVLIGPAGWQLLGLVVIMGVIWWWLARKPGAPPPLPFVLLRAIWWRLFPALTTWHETNQEKARARFGVNDFEGDEQAPPVRRPEWLHMSSQGHSPEHRIGAVPGTGTGPGPQPVPDKKSDNLTEDRVFRDTVLLKNKQGGWMHSGKKLYALWGGNHDEFLAKVRALRNEEAPQSKAEPPVSPIAGRTYDPKLFHSDNPELQYQEP